MNLFGSAEWNGPGSIFASHHRSPNITVEEANAAEERVPPPRDWPSDGEEEAAVVPTAPPISVCQEFSYEPGPPPSPPPPPHSTTLSGFGEPEECAESAEDALVRDILGGYESPYFAQEPPRKRARREQDPMRALRQVEEPRFGLSTDCCLERDGGPLYDDTLGDVVSQDQSRVWCFGCQWESQNYRPVDNRKIADLSEAFMNMILGGSVTLENIARNISTQYRETIREPARAQGQELPDWPPAVVKRHIENMTEPRVRNALLIRKTMAIQDMVFENSARYNSQTGAREPNMQMCTMWCRLLRETREMYRVIPKDSFGYNQNLRAETWNGSTLVHPTRVQRPANPEDGSGGADIRKYVVGSSVVDTGVPRGPNNDEELVSRPVGGTLSAESGY